MGLKNAICKYVLSGRGRTLYYSFNKAIFLETPTNPLMQQADIAAISEIAKRHGALLIVDNTFYTPLLQQPILLGADIVIHSATKYLGGHNDVLAGLIVAKGKDICEGLALHHNGAGGVLSPFDAWVLMRGMKTLALRMERHEKNAKAIVEYLSNHESVADVLYPGREEWCPSDYRKKRGLIHSFKI